MVQSRTRRLMLREHKRELSGKEREHFRPKRELSGKNENFSDLNENSQGERTFPAKTRTLLKTPQKPLRFCGFFIPRISLIGFLLNQI